MTAYLKSKFTLPAGPSTDVPWPFDRDTTTDVSAICRECGAATAPGRSHVDARDMRSTSKRVCFGRAVAR